MDKVIVNDALRTHLPNLDQQFTFYDESGRALGHFIPEGVYRELLMARTEPKISDEELARRLQEPRGRSLAEIWKSLGRE